MCQTALALEVSIIADTNRDGIVDVTDDLDKNVWTSSRGALFLANIADTDRRCSQMIRYNTSDERLGACHDASDNILRDPKYLAPLRTLPIEYLSPGAIGHISVVPANVTDKVRIFNKASSQDWIFISSNYTFTGEELSSGLELGIDARDVRRPDGWDGRVSVKFTVEDGAEVVEDTVALRVAPVLTHHHVQKAERVFVTGAQDAFRLGPQTQFVADLKKNTADAGISAPVHEFQGRDIWTQDFFESGYSSIPGPDGPVVLRIMIRSSQRFRSSGREIFTDLRDESVGAVQSLADGSSIDSTGNLETIPPYSLNGKSYPAGRIIMGAREDLVPDIFPFLQAQEAQEPLALDTEWLAVGHVDEFLQFLPADNARGWVLMTDDPREGLRILKQAVTDGKGATKAVSRPQFPYDQGMCLPTMSINEVLAQDEFEELNEMAASRIDGNIATLKRETGITEAEIFRLPALFYNRDFRCSQNNSAVSKLSSGPSLQPKPKNILEAVEPHHIMRRQFFEHQLWAFWPGMVNGVVLTDSMVLTPNPWGPIINGEDIFAAAARDSYSSAGFNVTFQDDWFSHHVGMGEIHCGSNVWRNADAPWWE